MINAYHCIMLRLVVFFFLLLTSSSLFSASVTFTSNCQQAYQSLISFRLVEARSILTAERQRDADNRVIDYLENYLHFFEVMASDDKIAYDSRLLLFEQRSEKLDGLPDHSPWKLFFKSECQTQWAILHFRMGEYLMGVWELRKAYYSVKQNRTRFPSFRPQLKTEAVIAVLLATVPESYTWALNLLGMQVGLSNGIADLQKMGEEAGNMYRVECELMYAILTMNLSGKKDEARVYLEQHNHPIQGNLLSHYVYAFLCVHSFQATRAIETLQQAPFGSAYPSFPYLDYLLGLAKTYRSDADAEKYLQRFIQRQSGRNHVRAAWQKIGWNRLLSGDAQGYMSAMSRLLREGRNHLDQDRQATLEARQRTLPSVHLLKARLLYDGGYFQPALDTLKLIPIHLFTDPERITEFYYRKGKIYQGLQQYDLATSAYLLAVKSGKNLHRYFASYASYELGAMAEKEGKKSLAKQYYTDCLSMPDNEYSTGLLPKIRLALQRVSL